MVKQCIVTLIIVLAALAVYRMVFESRPESPAGGERGLENSKSNAVEVAPSNGSGRSLMRKPLEAEATKRLANGPQEIVTTFQATGRGDRKKDGYYVSANFFFESFVRAESVIESKEESSRGNIKVTEIRKFIEVRDQLTFSETDMGLALCETLPVEKIAENAAGIGALMAMFSPLAGEMLTASMETMYNTIKSVDRTSLRGLCGTLGVEIPDDVEKMLADVSSKLANRQFENLRNQVHSIEGKSYRIVYLQDEKGAPLRVDFANVDGSSIDEDEWDILKLVNVFIDAQIISDKRVQPGDRWEIDAETVAALVDPVAQGGTCDGKITVEREDNLPSGDWRLRFLPDRITTKSDGGATVGLFKINEGNAIGDGGNAYVKAMQIVGTGRLGNTKRSRRFEIFDVFEKLGGDCEFRAFMSTNRKE